MWAGGMIPQLAPVRHPSSDDDAYDYYIRGNVVEKVEGHRCRRLKCYALTEYRALADQFDVRLRSNAIIPTPDDEIRSISFTQLLDIL
jgi:hypothetical protein